MKYAKRKKQLQQDIACFFEKMKAVSMGDTLDGFPILRFDWDNSMVLFAIMREKGWVLSFDSPYSLDLAGIVVQADTKNIPSRFIFSPYFGYNCKFTCQIDSDRFFIIVAHVISKTYRASQRVGVPDFASFKELLLSKGIASKTQYRSRAKGMGLPQYPEKRILDWQGWDVIFPRSERPERNFIKVVFPSYEEAIALCKANGIFGQRQYSKKRIELGLPSEPARTYKTSWTGWNDFFVLRREMTNWRGMVCQKKVFPTYEEAKAILKGSGITSWKEYYARYMEFGLPSNPDKHYKGQYISLEDMLSYPVKDDRMGYDELKQLVWENDVYTRNDYKLLKQRMPHIPSDPNITYMDKGWGSWNTFLKPSEALRVTKKVRSYNKRFISLNKAQEIVLALGIKSRKQFYTMTHILSLFYIHSHPERYKKWMGWAHFLKRPNARQLKRAAANVALARKRNKANKMALLAGA